MPVAVTIELELTLGKLSMDAGSWIRQKFGATTGVER